MVDAICRALQILIPTRLAWEDNLLLKSLRQLAELGRRTDRAGVLEVQQWTEVIKSPLPLILHYQLKVCWYAFTFKISFLNHFVLQKLNIKLTHNFPALLQLPPLTQLVYLPLSRLLFLLPIRHSHPLLNLIPPFPLPVVLKLYPQLPNLSLKHIPLPIKCSQPFHPLKHKPPIPSFLPLTPLLSLKTHPPPLLLSPLTYINQVLLNHTSLLPLKHILQLLLSHHCHPFSHSLQLTLLILLLLLPLKYAPLLFLLTKHSLFLKLHLIMSQPLIVLFLMETHLKPT